MLDLVVKDGRAAGIVTRDLTTGAVQSWSAHAVALCTGGYGNAYYLSTNAKASNVTAAWRAHRKGALFANPCFTQIHPTCIPRSDDFQSKLTLMSESLRNDGRVWIPKQLDDPRSPDQIPVDDRDYFLERRYPAFGNLVPRDVASRAIKTEVDAGRGVGPAEERRVPRLPGVDRAPRAGRRRGALRQPLRDVRAHHRREPVPGADAHLPRHPLHDGRAVGRLQPDEQRARAVRARRGELRRPGRQPPRGERARCRAWPTATSCSRRPSPTTSHRSSAPRRCRPTTPRSRSRRRRSPTRPSGSCRSTASTPSTTSTASSATSCGTTAGWRAASSRWRRRSPTSPRCARSSTPTCACPAVRRR